MKIKKLIPCIALLLAGVTVFVSSNEAKSTKVDATSFTPTTTEVTGLSHGTVGTNRQRLMASLSVADWGDTKIEHDTASVSGSGTRCGEYNYHTNVLVNGETMTEWSGFNTRCIFVAGDSKVAKLYFDINHANFVADDVVTFNSGTEFPSYNYVISGTGSNSYKLDSAISFKYSGSAWSVVVPFEERETKIASVKFTTGNATNHYCYMSVALTNYDYSGGETEDSTWTEMKNFSLAKIKLNGSAIQFDSARGGRYRAKNSTVMLYVYSADGTGSEYTSIVIPADTQFPSKAYHDSGEKSVYVVKNEIELYPTSAGFVEGTKADLITVSRVNSTRLRLGVSLTNFDHAAYTGDASIDTYPTNYPIFSSVLIDGSEMTRWAGMPDTRAYKFKGVAGWGFDFTFTTDAVPSTIVVKTGALFAATSYTDGGTEKYYVVIEDATFKNTSDYNFGCVNTVNGFINNKLKMDTIPTSDVGTGKCISEGWYTEAKTAYEALNEKDKSLFNTSSDYANARARLAAWADANGDTFTGTGFVTNPSKLFSSTLSENSNKTISIIVLVSITSLSLLGVLVYLKKRKIY